MGSRSWRGCSAKYLAFHRFVYAIENVEKVQLPLCCQSQAALLERFGGTKTKKSTLTGVFFFLSEKISTTCSRFRLTCQRFLWNLQNKQGVWTANELSSQITIWLSGFLEEKKKMFICFYKICYTALIAILLPPKIFHKKKKKRSVLPW